MADETRREDQAAGAIEAPVAARDVEEPEGGKGGAARADMDDVHEHGEEDLDEEDMEEPSFKVGDSVVVKPDETDPGSEQPIGGWQGRVTGSMKRTRCWPTSPGTA